MEFSHSYVDPSAYEMVRLCLESGQLSEGARVKDFERELKRVLKIPYLVTTNSGTNALHLALVALGTSQGDRVIIPPQTSIATALAVLMCGATPVFCDIDPDTGCIDPKKLENTIVNSVGINTIIPVHWAGYPCDLDEIRRFASECRMLVIEDACQALGAVYKGKPIGTISPLTVFSFQATKQLSTGDGGMICCQDLQAEKQLRIMRWFGIDRNKLSKGAYGRNFLATTPGYKYHMNDLAASLGMANLGSFRVRMENRQIRAALYRKKLAKVPGVKLLKYKSDRTCAYWVFSMLVERRDDFIRKMEYLEIPISIVDNGIDKHPIFGGKREELTGQRYWDQHHIALPVHDKISLEDIELITDTIKKGW